MLSRARQRRIVATAPQINDNAHDVPPWLNTENSTEQPSTPHPLDDTVSLQSVSFQSVSLPSTAPGRHPRISKGRVSSGNIG